MTEKTIEIFDKLIDSGISKIVLDNIENFVFTSYTNIMKSNLTKDGQIVMTEISTMLQEAGLTKQKIHPKRLLHDALYRLKKAIKQCGYDSLLELIKTGEFDCNSYTYKKAIDVALKYNITLNGTLQNDINKLQLNSIQEKGKNI